ncbi:hypothetical protein [Sphingomonas sp.]|uniref:hypothetical protein n=1 Tax=Sphingomonas sp. TaxID=28214 RepID=UPI002ED8E071
MVDSNDYYTHRAMQARTLAENARTSKARDIHLEMAERYTLRSRSSGIGRPDPIIVPPIS